MEPEDAYLLSRPFGGSSGSPTGFALFGDTAERLRKNSILRLLLGGATLQRCASFLGGATLQRCASFLGGAALQRCGNCTFFEYGFSR
jgi:hypothetical protein